MKLGLKRKRLHGKFEKSCLLFKAEGEVLCKYQTKNFISDMCVDVNSGIVYKSTVSRFQRWWLVHEQNPVQAELLRA